MKDEDPLQELRRIRDAMAKQFNYDVKALGEYLRSVPLLPGQKWYEQPESKTKVKKDKAKKVIPDRGKSTKSALKPTRRKAPVHA